jgi:hypothetical protein
MYFLPGELDLETNKPMLPQAGKTVRTNSTEGPPMTGEKYWASISPNQRERIYSEAIYPTIADVQTIAKASDCAFVFLPNAVKAFIYESEDWKSLADEE